VKALAKYFDAKLLVVDSSLLLGVRLLTTDFLKKAQPILSERDILLFVRWHTICVFFL
jgi:hypothetical protein